MTATATPPGPVRSRRGPLAVLGVAVVLLVASIPVAGFVTSSGSAQAGGVWCGWPAACAGTGGGYAGSGMMGAADGYRGPGMMGSGMMSGRVWLAGNGQPVTTLGQAQARAAQAAQPSGLRPGEVMQFTANFYVELKDASGQSVTEVLVDPASGAVATEPGPAMMWNTGSRTAAVTQDRATQIATGWLQANRPGETVTTLDAYPGYYTADTAAADGKPVRMLSVNATTGQVWDHTWHGTFVAEQDG